MFSRIINAIIGKSHNKAIQEATTIVSQINALYDTYTGYTHTDLLAHVQTLRDRISAGETIESILPEAFALHKTACTHLVGTLYTVKGTETTRNMIPYDVQLVGGILLTKRSIAEMKTGEGKTLVATLPVFLHALTGRGVHVVTVNDYLASRDAEQMRLVYEYLGCTVGCVTKQVPHHQRKDQYLCDITYIENSELGFDYLRDNLVKTMAERVLLHRPLYYAIVDEADSILIDEARTPLIISEPDSEPTTKYEQYARLIQSLTESKTKKKVSKGFLHDILDETKAELKEEKSDTDEGGDYYVDEKTKTVSLSSDGIAKLEKLLGVENVYRDFGFEEIHHIENALKARACYHQGKEYIVTNGEVVIVDENTGRAQAGRRFSAGLHQAIEAKEGVQIQKESKTIATITYQNFFKQYTKLAGMTGTAVTEAEEFDAVYELTTVSIPTHRPIIRVDKNDKVYIDQDAKRHALTEHISFAHAMGQPLLIGTSSIHTSEYVSNLLTQKKIIHSVLNAKFHEQEASIIGRAGQYGSVVVATNMAGRGTDIKLQAGLNERLATSYIQRALDTKYVSMSLYSAYECELMQDAYIQSGVDASLYTMMMSYTSKRSDLTTPFATMTIVHTDAKKDEPVTKDIYFGLGIIGTEKHESRRIDNQLRGRAGRQGDAGMAVFYLALDDMIMRKMGGDRIQSIAKMMLPGDEIRTLELSQKQFTSSIIRAQKQMEGRHFGIRKHLFDYDNVINKQRLAVYAKRDMIVALHEKILGSETIEPTNAIIDDVIAMIPRVMTQMHETMTISGMSQDEKLALIAKEFVLDVDTLDNIDKEIEKKIYATTDIRTLTDICSKIYLHTIDRHWMAHIDDMQHLREKVGLASYAQQDPLVLYKKESFEKYQALRKTIRHLTLVGICTIQLQIQSQANQSQSNDMQPIQNQSQAIPEPIQPASPKKYRPNDTVSVRYPDGRVIWDTKYKRIQEQIENGECVVVG